MPTAPIFSRKKYNAKLVGRLGRVLIHLRDGWRSGDEKRRMKVREGESMPDRFVWGSNRTKTKTASKRINPVEMDATMHTPKHKAGDTHARTHTQVLNIRAQNRRKGPT